MTVGGTREGGGERGGERGGWEGEGAFQQYYTQHVGTINTGHFAKYLKGMEVGVRGFRSLRVCEGCVR